MNEARACGGASSKPFVKKALAPPFEDLVIVDLMEGGDMVDRLMIKTDKGYYATPITFASEYPGPGCGMCREELVASFEGDGSWTFRMKETQKWSPRPPRWDFVREASVDDDGQIRLSPCTSEKGDPVACDRRNQDLLRRF